MEIHDKKAQFLKELTDRFPEHIIDCSDWPRPYCEDRRKVKAILLGCDPTAFDRNGQLIHLKTVFDIGGSDGRYFRDIEKNLECIGLQRSNIYVQNLCQNYFAFGTAKNKVWREAALLWIKELKDELATLSALTPVLLTSESLYRVLLNPGTKVHSARYLYSHPDEIPITSDVNRLGRQLLPLYRHRDYQLSDGCNALYRARLMSLFG